RDAREAYGLRSGVFVEGVVDQGIQRRNFVPSANHSAGLVRIITLQAITIRGGGGEVIGYAVQEVGNGRRGGAAGLDAVGVVAARRAIIDSITHDAGIRTWVPSQGNVTDC